VDDTGSLICRDELSRVDAEGVVLPLFLEMGEKRLILETDELISADRFLELLASARR